MKIRERKKQGQKTASNIRQPPSSHHDRYLSSSQIDTEISGRNGDMGANDIQTQKVKSTYIIRKKRTT